MFLKVTKSGYTQRDGEQFCDGRFLIVFCDPANVMARRPELRCLVRHVRMRQLGPWMMATADIDGFSLTLSGTYGGDGLPVSTTAPDKKAGVMEVWDRLHPMPPEIVELFWSDDGHNSSGKNGPKIREWAVANMDTMTKLKKRETPDDHDGGEAGAGDRPGQG